MDHTDRYGPAAARVFPSTRRLPTRRPSSTLPCC